MLKECAHALSCLLSSRVHAIGRVICSTTANKKTACMSPVGFMELSALMRAIGSGGKSQSSLLVLLMSGHITEWLCGLLIMRMPGV